jgi:hypothetical protein
MTRRTQIKSSILRRKRGRLERRREMFTMAKQRVFVTLFLMAFLFFGAVGAEARDRNDTNGSDRLLKGAAIGAAVGAVVQGVRGRTEGRELLKGAAVGGAVGAAAGAYSDYKQEKDAREDAERRGYYGGRGYYDHDRDQGRAYRQGRGSNRGDYYAPRYERNNRGRGRGHRHNARCNH